MGKISEIGFMSRTIVDVFIDHKKVKIWQKLFGWR